MKNKPTFVIGDIQGCYSEFRRLLKIIDPMKKNKIFCVGDLVNRGPYSERVVDYVLNNKIKSVLGNHDLHMMAMILGVHKKNDNKHTLQKILGKNKSIKIFEYFLKFPFAKLIVSNESKSLITHAGVLPSWSLDNVLSANEELTEALQQSCKDQMEGVTTFIEVMLNQELGEPFRRDAMKAPVEVAGIDPKDTVVQ